MIVRPFGGPKYQQNQDRVGVTGTPCVWCGQAIKDPWPFAVRVIDDIGNRFATREEYEDKSLDEMQGDRGSFPVGRNCARLLRASGVFVKELRERAAMGTYTVTSVGDAAKPFVLTREPPKAKP